LVNLKVQAAHRRLERTEYLSPAVLLSVMLSPFGAV
jgi:hypothetical protein